MSNKICPSCGSENEPESRFCESCGTRLPEIAAPIDALPVRTVPAMPPFLKQTPAADSSAVEEPPPPPPELEAEAEVEPIPSTFIIPEEEQAVPEAIPAPVEDVAPLKAAPNTVVLPEPGGRLQFEDGPPCLLVGEQVYFVGRTDPANGWYPAVDLTPHGGETGGVSRRHARFFVQNSILCLEDLSSTNGTFLNEERLIAGTSYPLTDGDALRFGRINAVYYANVA